MPAWITITSTDLNDAKVAALVDALRTAALASGQADPTVEIIAGITAEIRSNIAGCRTNVLDIDATTIPRELKALACRMVVREAQSRLQLELNADEKTEQTRDDERLKAIRSCDLPVEAPDNPQTTPEVQRGGAAELVNTATRKTGRCQLDGL